MSRATVGRLVSAAVMTAGVALLIFFAWRFPWARTGAVVRGAHVGWLAVAALVNLASIAAKAQAWHLLLRRSGQSRARTAMAATYVGTAVSTFGLSVAGEAARVRYVTARSGVTTGAAVRAIVASRVVEAVALVAIVAGGAAFLQDVPWVNGLRAGSVAALGLILLLSSRSAVEPIARRLPVRVTGMVRWWLDAVRRPETHGALAFALVNWVAQWLAYFAAGRAIALPHAGGIALAALIVSNVGGVFRLTPGNVGVLQASFVLAALPHHVAAAEAVAAALLLQAIQIVPVIVTGAAIIALPLLTGFRRGEPAGP